MRLDQYLTKHYNIQSRNKANELIRSNNVKIDGKIISKPSFVVDDGMKIEILEDEHYVSRAAYKLKYFLEEIPTLDINDLEALDIGSSTGGFTQILLNDSAKSVTCVDVGSNQLHEKIKSDPRIKFFENCDIRKFKSEKKYDIVTCDVSFISIHNILNDIDTFAGRHIIILFKPQYEVGKTAKRDSKGVVKDKKAIELSRLRFIDACKILNWNLVYNAVSKLDGKEGNSEELFYFLKESKRTTKSDITSICIGAFDGMHLAHQELFKLLDDSGAIVVIETGYANLTPKTHRQEYSKYPIYYYPLDEIKTFEGEKFIALLLEEFPNLKKIVVGFDFCFGKNRKYCTDELKNLFNGKVEVLDEFSIDNIAVHSRIIREFIRKGEIEQANRLLGKEYKISGRHIKGQGLGKKEFVPTINLHVSDFLLPNEGVYITKTMIKDKEYESVSFIGHRVSTDGSFAVETHLLLVSQSLSLPVSLEIKFLKKLRDNKKFDSFEELKEQIEKDINEAKNYFL